MYRIARIEPGGIAVIVNDTGRQVAWGELRLADQHADPERMDICPIELVITGTPDDPDWDHLLDDYQRDTGTG